MGYSKRRACSKSKILPEDLLQIQQQYLRDIKAAVQLEDIPADGYENCTCRYIDDGQERIKTCKNRAHR